MEKNSYCSSEKSNPKNRYSKFAEEVLNKALNDFRKRKIQEKIDQSLEKRNKKEFLRLTEDLKDIT